MQNHIRPLFAAFSFASLLVAATPALAANYPYCMSRVAGRIGMVEECNYVSMEQCWANAVGLAGSCAPNWRLQYYRKQNGLEEPAARPRYKRRYE
jgi:Protein of unknown function (DUF3551)